MAAGKKSSAVALGPAEFAFFRLGLRPYPWQARVMRAASRVHSRVALVAANGSGKTAAVNVPLLLWFLATWPKGRAMVTSGSWQQLKNQLLPNLRSFAPLFPEWHFGADRVTTPEGGFIAAFSTDDPGRAEGAHENLDGAAPVMLMVDEAKSVGEPIFEALGRCTPTFFVLTSSPGSPTGTFYRAFQDPAWAGMYYGVRATFDDCPHLPESRRQRAQVQYGPDYEHHPVYRSMILAEFTEGSDACIISRELLLGQVARKPLPRPGVGYAGVDWAAGGDETVLAVREGNQLRVVWRAREKRTPLAAEQVVGQLRALGVEESNSWGDAAGLGTAVMQAAEEMHGFRFRYFNGGLPAEDKEHYQDLNIEAWMYFRASLERGEVCFADGLDEECIRQLTDRYLMWDSKGRLRCERKDEMRERGVHSPDRADALVMAWWAGRYMEYTDPQGDDEPEPGYYGAQRPAVFPRGGMF